MIIVDSCSHGAQHDAQLLAEFRAEVLRGLRNTEKELPSKYFYDQRGSDLFELITELPEYYPTRTEMAIMDEHAADMAARLGPRCQLIEYGSGSSIKTRLLLNVMSEVSSYVPVDVSGDFVQTVAARLRKAYPAIEIAPVCADFTRRFNVPTPHNEPTRRAVYFPGSTIGNFTPDAAVAVLRQARELVGSDGRLLLGADLQKDLSVLHAAYNDGRGVTAEFNRNILVRINRELDGDFAVRQFSHRAYYNEQAGRIEMHLVSSGRQEVHIAGRRFSFAPDESIRTEYSYKFTLQGLGKLAERAGFVTEKVWTDTQHYFCVALFRSV